MNWLYEFGNKVKCPNCSKRISIAKNIIGVTRCKYCLRPFSIHHAKGKDLLNKGKTKQAIDELEKASRHMRTTASIFLDLARAYGISNQNEEMRNALRRAFDIDPEFVITNWLRDTNFPEITTDNVESVFKEILSVTEKQIKDQKFK